MHIERLLLRLKEVVGDRKRSQKIRTCITIRKIVNRMSTLILKLERCRSGRSSTLGKRILRATRSKSGTSYRIGPLRLSYPKLSLRVRL